MILLVLTICFSSIVIILSPPVLSGPPVGNAVAVRFYDLGYISEVDITDLSKFNVTLHSKMASDGVNAFCSENGNEVRIMAMDGSTIRAYSLPMFNNCKLIEPYDDDSFLVLIEERAVVRMGYDGEIHWISRGPFHHDLDVAEDGSIYVLSSRARVIQAYGDDRVKDNFIQVLSPSGQKLSEVSIGAAISNDLALVEIAKMPYEFKEDIFHANTLELINVSHALICLRNMDLVAVLDMSDRTFPWHWGPGILDRPHHPSMLSDGRMMVFDNGWHREWSRVIEVDTETFEVIWEYSERGFFSKSRGAAQRLSNGNTLITESDKGRVFEVTSNGQVAWEYWNTHKREGRRGTIYRMIRL